MTGPEMIGQAVQVVAENIVWFVGIAYTLKVVIKSFRDK